jgi:tetratricopeptide (TPR) repeat protein
MRRPALILIALLMGARVGAAEESRDRIFVQALEAFDKAKTDDDYRHVAETLETLLADGYQNGAVYYNLGNAWMKAGEHGRAIAAYRKALPLRPRDPYLVANLNHAIATAPGRLPQPPQEWWRNIFFWQNWLSLPEKFSAMMILFSLATVLALAALKWTAARRQLYSAAAFFVLLGVLAGVDGWIGWSEVEHSRHAVVVAESVARKGNSNEYEKAFDQPLKDGAEFTIIERRGDWVFGHFEGAGDGWLPKSNVVE